MTAAERPALPDGLRDGVLAGSLRVRAAGLSRTRGSGDLARRGVQPGGGRLCRDARGPAGGGLGEARRCAAWMFRAWSGT